MTGETSVGPTSARHGRLTRRLVRHHLPLALVTAAALAGLHAVTGFDRAVRDWSVSTAWVGLALLAATLLLGPLRVLRGRRIGVSDDLRRDLGIWAALVGIAHVVFGLQVHLGGRLAKYFGSVNLFGLANWTGLAATAVLALLLLLSNDRSLTALRSRRWKALHRLAYPLLAVTLVHAVLYLHVEARMVPLLAVLILVGAVVTALQLAGRARRRRPRAVA
jgi:sulfoxide reductase heme-binding subunit YedZ